MTVKEQIANKCIHFTGLIDHECRKGITYPRDQKPYLSYLPCFKVNNIQCEKQHFPTAQEQEAILQEYAEAFTFGMKAIKAVNDNFKQHGQRFGTMPCVTPECKGQMEFRIAELNNHVHCWCAACNNLVKQ